jgi:hypothetical protein
MHHAVMSSIAAHTIVTAPIRLRSRPRSLMIRASTGNAVTLIAAPVNSTNTGRDAVSLPYSRCSQNASAPPRTNGVIMPLCAITTDVQLARRKCAGLRSMPTRHMKNTSPK